MNLLADAAGTEPAGAAALLALGDPDELTRFRFLEDRVWDAMTLAAPVIEAVRIRSARVRGCEFCASVRMSGALEAGLSETQLDAQDSLEHRAALPAEQQAALRLVDAFLIDRARPSHEELDGIVAALGPEGVVEVLVACAVFASADLRIALGDNREANTTAIERAHTRRPRASRTDAWPSLATSIVLPSASIPLVDPQLDDELRALRRDLFAQTDVPAPLLRMFLVRSAQLLGADGDDVRRELLAPAELRGGTEDKAVRTWTQHLEGLDRELMAFAEQLWIDPSGLDEDLVAPLRRTLGDAALVRIAWRLIWIGQLQRISLVLGPEGTP